MVAKPLDLFNAISTRNFTGETEIYEYKNNNPGFLWWKGMYYPITQQFITNSKIKHFMSTFSIKDLPSILNHKIEYKLNH